MKIMISVKCVDDNGKKIKDGNFPQEVVCTPCFDKGASDLEKLNLMLKAFAEISTQTVANIFAEEVCDNTSEPTEEPAIEEPVEEIQEKHFIVATEKKEEDVDPPHFVVMKKE